MLLTNTIIKGDKKYLQAWRSASEAKLPLSDPSELGLLAVPTVSISNHCFKQNNVV